VGNSVNRVGFAWDDTCLGHVSGPMLRSDTASSWLPTPNFESPERLLACRQVLQASGRLDLMVPLPPRRASLDDLRLVHTAEHLEMVRSSEGFDGPALVGDAICAGPGTWDACRAAAGAVIGAVSEVVAGRLDSAFALVRPPGHHATPDTAMGSCLVNNVAVAARYAQQHLGAGRVAIVDWDVHHGNGTEDVFADDASVLFLSTHQENFYPPDRGHVADRGSAGTTVNVPLPAGSGDEGYFSAFDRVIVPALRAFAPDLVFVSAGQDAAGTDPLGRMCVSADGFRGLARRVLDAAGGRVVAVLEGGYSLGQMPWCVLAIVEELLGVDPSFERDPMAIDGPTTLRPEETAAIDRVVAELAARPVRS
jgi:acetoin utilization deacetylase AcuC-like enzyme